MEANMSKTIVSKNEINTDEKLAIVKAFRIANKRAGEVKKIAIDDNQSDEVRSNALVQFEEWCSKLRELTAKAEAKDFKIWVNFNGRTGHTYSKDYKPTPDSDNDYEAFSNMIAEQQQIISNIIFPPPPVIPPSLN
jgi:hypothetical protein